MAEDIDRAGLTQKARDTNRRIYKDVGQLMQEKREKTTQEIDKLATERSSRAKQWHSEADDAQDTEPIIPPRPKSGETRPYTPEDVRDELTRLNPGRKYNPWEFKTAADQLNDDPTAARNSSLKEAIDSQRSTRETATANDQDQPDEAPTT